MTLKLARVDHIAIAVADIEASLALYENTFGCHAGHRERIDDYGVEIATIQIGDTAIELVQGTTHESPISKFVKNRGPGIHHIAFAVDDIRAALEQLESQGMQLIDREPRRGKEDSLVAFIHPRATHGVLYELVQLA
jgi:methylmalonyl-CoA/ethylmalonyl-CoA epimerase